MWYDKTDNIDTLPVAALSLKYEIAKFLEKGFIFDAEDTVIIDDINQFYRSVISLSKGVYDDEYVATKNIELYRIYVGSIENISRHQTVIDEAEEEYEILKKLTGHKSLKKMEISLIKTKFEKLLSSLDSSFTESISDNSFYSWGY